MTIWQQLMQGGVALIPLGLCSILVVAVSLDRLWTYSRVGRVPKELIRRIENLIASGDWQAAIRLLDDSPSPYTRIAKASLMQKNATEQEITDLLTLACDAEIAAAASSIPVLGTIGNIAPFIGLFGTVIGIMKAFAQMSTSGGSDVIMKGVAEALIATAAGLAVGIVSVVANNWCNAWLERYRLDLERFSTEWSYLLQSLKREDAIEEPVA